MPCHAQWVGVPSGGVQLVERADQLKGALAAMRAPQGPRIFVMSYDTVRAEPRHTHACLCACGAVACTGMHGRTWRVRCVLFPGCCPMVASRLHNTTALRVTARHCTPKRTAFPMRRRARLCSFSQREATWAGP